MHVPKNSKVEKTTLKFQGILSVKCYMNATIFKLLQITANYKFNEESHNFS